MSVSVHEEVEEVDLSKLINFGMTFEPLQLTIRDILRRLAQLERQNITQDDRIDQLTATVGNLEEANRVLEEKVKALSEKVDTAESQEKDDANTGNDSDAIWDEIGRLNSLLGELQDGAERDRHTIDEIYAARKRRHSSASAMATAAAGEEEEDEADGAGSRAESAKPVTSAGESSSAKPPSPAARKPSVARPLRTTEESAPTKPVGDVILDRAREDLHLDGTNVFRAFEEGAATAPVAVEGPHAAALPQTSDHPAASSVVSLPSHGSPSTTPLQQPGLPPRPHSVSISFASRPQSGAPGTAAAGGEEAGEHRGSVAFARSPVSRPASHAQRRSIYADQRIAAAAARRASQFSAAGGSEGVSPSASVFDKLRRDGDDIAYLNRVVAEILGEMKELHADVDQLRTSPPEEEETNKEAGSAATPADGAVAAEELEAVLRRLTRVEHDVADARQQLQKRDDGLQEELDDLKKQLHVARGLTDDDLDALRGVRNLAERVRQLEERLRALEAANGALTEQFASVLAVGQQGEDGGAASEINPLQFAALQGAVKNLEKQLADLLAAQGEGQQDWSEPIRKLTESVRAVERDVATAQDQLQRVSKEASRLEEAKANRSELPDPALFGNNGKRRSSAESSALADLAGRMTRAEAALTRLNEDKADRTAMQKLRDELNALRQLVDSLRGQRNDGAALEKLEKALRDLQMEMNNVKDASRNAGSGGSGIGGEDVEDLRDRLERLDHCKADATLVANKAERDYVENALERLMREVEQVLNATNAGLIDTLEKSLNILRDMIDGKATKQDVANLQGWMAESSGGAAGAGAGAADGLTGFKGFRCLGCNRPMDNMRPRTLPATMTPFLNRNPQNFPQDNVTRTIQQQQQRGGGGVAGGNAGVSSHSAGARPAAAGSPDVSVHRSTNSEPLPPIEQA